MLGLTITGSFILSVILKNVHEKMVYNKLSKQGKMVIKDNREWYQKILSFISDNFYLLIPFVNAAFSLERLICFPYYKRKLTKKLRNRGMLINKEDFDSNSMEEKQPFMYELINSFKDEETLDKKIQTSKEKVASKTSGVRECVKNIKDTYVQEYSKAKQELEAKWFDKKPKESKVVSKVQETPKKQVTTKKETTKTQEPIVYNSKYYFELDKRYRREYQLAKSRGASIEELNQIVAYVKEIDRLYYEAKSNEESNKTQLRRTF